MIALALLMAQSVAVPAAGARGEQIFAQNCSVGYCHGIAGVAGRGPRLRGRSFAKDYLYNVTRDGIPSSAMPAWKDRLKEDDIRAVVEDTWPAWLRPRIPRLPLIPCRREPVRRPYRASKAPPRPLTVTSCSSIRFVEIAASAIRWESAGLPSAPISPPASRRRC